MAAAAWRYSGGILLTHSLCVHVATPRPAGATVQIAGQNNSYAWTTGSAAGSEAWLRLTLPEGVRYGKAQGTGGARVLCVSTIP